jgi:2'-5' RNA ligase
MRLFFALWPDSEVRARLARWSRELQAVCGGRPTRPGNLHLTLAFLGSVEDARAVEVEKAAGVVPPRAASLVLDTPGYWKHNRIAWAGASKVPGELEAMAAELRGALKRSRVDFDSKAFVSHVTLLRDAQAPGAMPVLEPISWNVEGFALLRSQPRPGGVRYEVVRSW